MAGGLLQLIAAGTQDYILYGNPEISFFKTVYRRYSTFARTNLDVNFKTTPSFNRLHSAILPKHGDLLNNIYLKITLPELKAVYKYTNSEEIALLYSTNNTYDHNITIYENNTLRLDNALQYLNNITKYYLVRYTSTEYEIVDYFAKLSLLKQLVSHNTNYYIQNTDLQNYLLNPNTLYTDANNNKLNSNSTGTQSYSYLQHYNLQSKMYTVIINTDISTWTFDNLLSICFFKNDNTLKTGSLIVTNYSVTSGISTITCFFNSGDITTFTIDNFLCDDIGNVSQIITITDVFSINLLDQYLEYILTYNDDYNYLIYFLNLQSNTSEEILTANDFIFNLYQLLSNFIFNQHIFLTLTNSISSWTFQQIYINYRDNQSFYDLLFIYQMDVVTDTLTQIGYGIIYDISDFTIDFVYLAGQVTIPDSDLYVSSSGTLDLNDQTIYTLNDFTEIIRVVSQSIIIDNELIVYNKISKINISQYTTIDAINYISSDLVIVFNQSIISSWITNNLIINDIFDFVITNINIDKYSTQIQSTLTTTNTTVIANINDICKLTYNSETHYSDRIIINSVLFDQLINNVSQSQYDITFVIDTNLISWFFGDLLLSQTQISNSDQADIIFSTIGISTTSSVTNFTVRYKTVRNNFTLPFAIIDSIPTTDFIDFNTINYYLFDANNLQNFNLISQINFIFYDNYYTFSYAYTQSNADKSYITNAMLNSMTSNYTLVKNTYNSVFTDIMFVFRSFVYNGGNINGVANEIITSTNFTSYFNNYISGVTQTYLTPLISQFNTEILNYKNYFLTALNTAINTYISTTNYNLIENLSVEISFLKNTNSLNNIIITINSDLTSWSLVIGQILNVRNSSNSSDNILAKLTITNIVISSGITTITCDLLTSFVSLNYVITNNYIFKFDDSVNTQISAISNFYTNYSNLKTAYSPVITSGTYFVNYLLLDYMMQINNYLLNTSTNGYLNKIVNISKYLFTIDGNFNSLINTLTYQNDNLITVIINSDLTSWGLLVGQIIEIRELQSYGYYRTNQLEITNLVISSTLTTITCSLYINPSIRLLHIPIYMFSNDNSINIQINNLTPASNNTMIIYINQNLQTSWNLYLNVGLFLNFRETNNNTDTIFITTNIINVSYTYWSTSITVSFISLTNINRFIFTPLYLLSNATDTITYNSSNNIDLIFNTELIKTDYNVGDILNLKYTIDTNDNTKYKLILNSFNFIYYKLYIYSTYNLIEQITSISVITSSNIELTLSNAYTNTLGLGIELVLVQFNSNYITNYALFTLNSQISDTVFNVAIDLTNTYKIRSLSLSRTLYVDTLSVLIDEIIVLNNTNIIININQNLTSWLDTIINDNSGIIKLGNDILNNIVINSYVFGSTTTFNCTFTGSKSNLADMNKIIYNYNDSLSDISSNIIAIGPSIIYITINKNLLLTWSSSLNNGSFIYLRDTFDILQPILATYIVSATSFTPNNTYITATLMSTVTIPLNEFQISTIINSSTLEAYFITDRYIFSYDDSLNDQVQIEVYDKNNIIITTNSVLAWSTYLDKYRILKVRTSNSILDPIIAYLVITYNPGTTTIYTKLVSLDSDMSLLKVPDMTLSSFYRDKTVEVTSVSGSYILTINSDLTNWNLIEGDILYLNNQKLIVETISLGVTTTINVRIFEDNSLYFKTDTNNYTDFIMNKTLKEYNYLYNYLIEIDTYYNTTYPTLTNDSSKIYIGVFDDFKFMYNTSSIINELFLISDIPNIMNIFNNIINNLTISETTYSNDFILSIDIILDRLIIDTQTNLQLTSLQTLLLQDTDTYYNYINGLLNLQFIGNTIYSYNNLNIDQYEFITNNTINKIPNEIINLSTTITEINALITETTNNISYYNNNKNILNINYLNLNNNTFYSTDAELIKAEIKDNIETTLKYIQIFINSLDPIWSFYLNNGDVLNIRIDGNINNPILTSLTILSKTIGTSSLTLFCSYLQGDLTQVINNSYVSKDDGSIFNELMTDVKIIYNYESVYEITDNQKYIVDLSLDSIFMPQYSHFTVFYIEQDLTTKFKKFYNDFIILLMIQNTLVETDEFVTLIQTTNIINTQQYAIDIAFPVPTTDIEKTTIIQALDLELTDTYLVYKNCIMTTTEYDNLYPTITLIDSLSGGDLVIYQDINIIYNYINLIIFTYFRSYITFSSYTNPVIFTEDFINYDDNILQDALSDFIASVTLTIDLPLSDFNNPDLIVTDQVILYKTCIITKDEEDYINTFSNLPPSLYYFDIAETIVRRDLTYNDSGYRLYNNCVITVDELTYITTYSELPSTLVLIGTDIYRKTDLQYGFTYDMTEITRTKMYNKELMDNFYTLIDNINTNSQILNNKYYNIAYSCINSRVLDNRKILKVFLEKNLELVPLITYYDQSFFFTQKDFINFTKLQVINTIVSEIALNRFKVININGNLDFTDLEYESQTIDINNIVTEELLNNNIDVFILNYIENLVEQKVILLDQYNKYIELQPQITIINNRTSSNAPISWIRKIGHYILDFYEFRIGENIIDTHTDEYLNIYHELFDDYGHDRGYDKMIGNVESLTNYDTNKKSKYTLYIPLRLWFNHNTRALPLIAILYNDIELKVKIKDINQLVIKEDNVTITTNLKLDMKLMINYIYLDRVERKLFAESRHEYLIETIQYDEKLLSESETIIDLNFQNACKDMYYVLVDGIDSYLPIESSKLTLNDSDRFEMTGLESSNLMQLYYKKNQDNNINIFTFALDPLDSQPSGSLNFTFIQKSRLTIRQNNVNPVRIKIFARTYNILRIFSGFCGKIFL